LSTYSFWTVFVFLRAQNVIQAQACITFWQSYSFINHKLLASLRIAFSEYDDLLAHCFQIQNNNTSLKSLCVCNSLVCGHRPRHFTYSSVSIFYLHFFFLREHFSVTNCIVDSSLSIFLLSILPIYHANNYGKVVDAIFRNPENNYAKHSTIFPSFFVVYVVRVWKTFWNNSTSFKLNKTFFMRVFRLKIRTQHDLVWTVPHPAIKRLLNELTGFLLWISKIRCDYIPHH